jgi:nucleoside-diphosphate-sugar epimerase
MEGCDYCFHLGGLARQWSPDPNDFWRINVDGTRNVLAAAERCGVERTVFTSTAGVWGPSLHGMLLDENSPRLQRGKTVYELTKQQAENVLHEFVQQTALWACIVNPSRVFGPGPLNEANSLTRIMWQYAKGNWRLMPGFGNAVGNYVHLDDVVEGHLLAMVRGQRGWNYLLGGENLAYRQLFRLIGACLGNQRRLFPVPRLVGFTYSTISTIAASWRGTSPRLTPSFTRKYFSNYPLSIQRAVDELGYRPKPVADGIRETCRWIQSQLSAKAGEIVVDVDHC